MRKAQMIKKRPLEKTKRPKRPTSKKGPTSAVSREELDRKKFERRMERFKTDKGFASSEFATTKDKMKFLDRNRKLLPKTKIGQKSKAKEMIKTKTPNATPFRRGGRA